MNLNDKVARPTGETAEAMRGCAAAADSAAREAVARMRARADAGVRVRSVRRDDHASIAARAGVR